MLGFVVALGIGICFLVVLAVAVFAWILFDSLVAHFRERDDDGTDDWETDDDELSPLLGVVAPHKDEKEKN